MSHPDRAMTRGERTDLPLFELDELVDSVAEIIERNDPGDCVRDDCDAYMQFLDMHEELVKLLSAYGVKLEVSG